MVRHDGGVGHSAEDGVFVFLLAGQSNMSGRGTLPSPSAAAAFADPRIRVWRGPDGWAPAADPLHADKPTAGVGPGLAFARAVLARLGEGAEIRLVPAAVGGSEIARWSPRGGDLFDAAAAAARAALAASDERDGLARSDEPPKLAGILWHQGESDAVSAALATAYAPALRELLAALPGACGSAGAAIVLGELGLGFLDTSRGGRFEHAPSVNGAICAVVADAVATGARVGLVSARGLVDRGDRLHFSSGSAELLGERYARRWLQLAVPRAVAGAGENNAEGGLFADGKLDPPLLCASPAALALGGRRPESNVEGESHSFFECDAQLGAGGTRPPQTEATMLS